MKLMLRLITGEAFEKTVMDSSFVIGRSQKCQVVVPHEGVSRQHVQVDIINGDIFITDLGSTNGVMINGEKIPPNKKVLFQTFLELSFGAVQSLMMEYETSDASRVMIIGNDLKSKYGEKAVAQKAELKKSKAAEVAKPGKVPVKGKPAPGKKKDSDSMRMMINVLIICFLVGVVYYILTNKPTTDDDLAPLPKSKSNEEYI